MKIQSEQPCASSIRTQAATKLMRVTTLGLSIVMTATLVFAAAPRNGIAVAASPGVDQIEPQAGTWHTWLLKSGSQLRLPAPPNNAATQKELAELKALVPKRDTQALDQIAFWNTGAPAYRWNEMLINETLKRNMNNNVAGRALALLNAALSDATVAAWDSKYAHNRPRPSAFDTSLTTAIPVPSSPAYPSEHATTAGAASAILAYLFPNDAQRFADQSTEAGNAFLMAGVSYPSDVKAGLDLGRKVAQLAIARAKADGSDAKWTGSVPKDAGKWSGENPVLPLAGTWKTWVLKSGDELRPPAPPAFDSPQMLAELKETKIYSRTPKSNATAMFWEFGAGGLRGYAFWNDQTSRKLMEYRLDDNPPQAARAYALASIAFYDSGVACWDAKYTYWAIRPFQLDPEFKPLFTTPNHPSYPAAHSCYAGAAATTLAYLFPRDAATLTALADQSGESRIWGGIHVRSDVDAGLALGQAVAQKVIERADADDADTK